VKVAAWGVVAILVAGGAATYGGFVVGHQTDLGVGSRHAITVRPQAGCANPAPVVVGHTVWDSETASPPSWTGPVHGTLTVTRIDPDPPHLRHAVFVADDGGQVSFSGGVGRGSLLTCAVSG
jgi:hypothetical protein